MQEQKHIRFDWAIKRLLRQKANFEILEGFLSELLKEDVEIEEILDSETNQMTVDDKHNRVDILVKNSKDELIIIEVQNAYEADYFHRILYSISKVTAEHLKRGEFYHKIKKVISVNIVYFDLGQGEGFLYKGNTKFFDLYSNEELGLTNFQKNYFGKTSISDIYPDIYLIKVNKFNDMAKNTLEEWIYFLKHSEIKSDFSARGIKKANQVLKLANMTETERRSYEQFMSYILDIASTNHSLFIRSEYRDRELAKKMAEKMVEEKLEANRKSLILNLLNMGVMTIEQIAIASQTTTEYVEQLKEEIQL